MDLTFLGTSAGAPTRQRNMSALALRENGHWDLFDCGEGTQHQLVQTPLTLARLRRVFISHLHGDHCFGLFGLLASRSMDATTAPLTIIGPSGLRRMVETVLTLSTTYLTYPVIYIEVPPEGGRVAVATGDDGDAATVDAVPLAHSVTSFAWWIREAERPGRFDVGRAEALGVPAGPLFGRLQHGETVELADGRRIEAADVVGSTRPGRRLLIAGDNSDPGGLLDVTDAVDVLVHEATFTEPVVAAIGDDRSHSTAARVARAAQIAGVGHLVLTHFSARYSDVGEPPTIDEIRREARAHFDGPLTLAADFDHFDVAPDGTLSIAG